jgi:foldase protein PrsA
LKPLSLAGVAAVALLAGAAVAAPKPAAKPAAKAPAKPAAPAAAKPTVPPGAVAVVGGVPITRAEVNDRLWREVAPQMIDRLINQQIIFLEAKKRGISVTAKEVQDQIDEQKNMYLQTPGRSPKDWDDFINRYGKANVETDMKIQVLVKKIGESESKAAKLTPEEEKQILDDLDREANKVHAKHILVGMGPQFNNRSDEDAKKRMAEVQAKLAGGASWDEVAKEYSDDVSNKDKGGDLGFFTRNRMVKEFEDAAFSLKPGETTKDPVKTAYGYHLINVVEVQNTPPTEDQKKKAIADRLEQKKRMAASAGSWFTNIKKNYKITNTMPLPNQ